MHCMSLASRYADDRGQVETMRPLSLQRLQTTDVGYNMYGSFCFIQLSIICALLF